MVENYNLILLAGGRTLCQPQTWNKSATSIDQCFKLYFPVAGDGEIRINDQWHSLQTDQFYFICGYEIEAQRCQSHLDVYWVHFIPASLELTHILLQGPALFSWPKAVNRCHECALEILPKFRDDSTGKLRNAASVCRVHAMILFLIADYVRQNEIQERVEEDKTYARIKPSIAFMNENIRNSPSLKEIAARSHLAPNYFHRVFQQLFHTTPLAYLTRQRLNNARQLLSSTTLTMKEVAARVGYKNEFYFSRLFKKHFNMSPTQFRKSFTEHI